LTVGLANKVLPKMTKIKETSSFEEGTNIDTSRKINPVRCNLLASILLLINVVVKYATRIIIKKVQ
jgi:hypothetical protein